MNRTALPLALCSVLTLVACDADDGYAVEAAGFREDADRFRQSYIADSIVAQDKGEPSLLFDGTKYLGVRIWQNPCDLQAWQELVCEYKPDLIIETGTAQGGLALLFAHTLDRVHPTGRVHTIEFDPKVDDNIADAHKIDVFDEYVTVHKGDSADPKWCEQLAPLAEGKRVIVTLDSDHSSVHVTKELALYAELVPPGGYLVVQDTVADARTTSTDSPVGM